MPDLTGARLIVVAGAPAAGKTSWADRNFPGQVFSRDWARGLLTGSEGRPLASVDADDPDGEDADGLIDYIIAGRLARGLVAVVDSTGTSGIRRLNLIDMVPPYGRAELVIVDTPLDLCVERNRQRPEERRVPGDVLVSLHLRVQLMVASLPAIEQHRDSRRVWDAVTVVRGDR